MTPIHYLILAILYALATFGLSSFSLGGPKMPGWRLDLLAHAIEYGILALLIGKWLQLGKQKGTLLRLSLTIALAALIGGLNEIYQSTIPGRTAAWDDAVANTIGAGAVAFRMGYHKRRTKRSKDYVTRSQQSHSTRHTGKRP